MKRAGMPEAAIDENGDSNSSEDIICRPPIVFKRLHIHAIAEATSVYQTPYC